MRIYGIDFTSRPRRGKPITCAACKLRDGRLAVDELLLWSDFAEFEAAWAWTRRDRGYGLPEYVDPLEGWIADPHVRAS